MSLEGLNPYKLKQFAQILARTVQDYMQDPEHRREFEKWYLKEYGKPYVWKTLADKENERKSNYDNDERRVVEAPC